MTRPLKFLVLIVPVLCFASAISACTKEKQRPSVIVPVLPPSDPEATEGTVSLDDVETYTAFSAGEGANSFRIPSVMKAKDGSLLVFCEARHNSWTDKSYTDIVVKRSTDSGKTWSEQVNLTGTANGGGYAFMDPTPVMDAASGKIFLFTCRWVKGNSDASNNRAFVVTSSDNGLTWSSPEDVTGKVVEQGYYIAGFGPSSGVTVAGGKYAGRMIFPTRQYDGTQSSGFAVYSDDSGMTWKRSSYVLAGESQIAEASEDNLVINIRKGSDRYASFSKDGGSSWSTATMANGLPSLESGCHASVFGKGDGVVFYCGPVGPNKTSSNDNRFGLTLYRSITSAQTWTKHQELYELASGYPDMTVLDDGRLAIVFEAGPEKGFTRMSGSRPAGWIRIDVKIIPGDVLDAGYWFE